MARACHAHPTLSEAFKEACMSTYGKPIHFWSIGLISLIFISKALILWHSIQAICCYNQNDANLDGGLTLLTTPPFTVETSMENRVIESISDIAYLKVPVISVYPSL